jgi:hypothetical protein
MRREIIHPIIKEWEDFSEDEKQILKNIKKSIEEVFQKEVFVCLFGSRIKGYWRENSDYDVCINENLTEDLKQQIRDKNPNIKIDLFCFFNYEKAQQSCIKIISNG